MPTTTQDQRRRLLTRTDLERLGVSAPRVEEWLASGSIEQVGELPVDGGLDAVFAAHAVPVRDELRRLLAASDGDDVALEPVAVRALLLSALLELRGMEAAAPAAPGEAATNGAKAAAAPVGASDSLSTTLASVGAALEDVLAMTGDDREPSLGSDTGRSEITVVDEREDAPVHVVTAGRSQQSDLIEFAPDATEVLELLARDEADMPRNWRTNPDPEALVETLQKIHVALVSLAERKPPERGPDPIATAIEQGLASLREALMKSFAEMVSIVRSMAPPQAHSANAAGHVAANASVPAAPGISAAPAGAFAAPAGVSAAPAGANPPRRGGRSVVFASVAALLALGWGAALWLYTGDLRTAVIALVAANVLACAAILWRRS